MKFLILILISFSFNSFSNVNSGDVINAVEINNRTFTIGDIKNSILPLNKFQELHGSCWIQLNQGLDNSNIDISNTDLATALNTTSIKSASGRVLRAEGGNSASLGLTQEDALQNHKHRNSNVAEQNGLLSQSITLRFSGSFPSGVLNSQGVFSTTSHNNFGQIEDDKTGGVIIGNVDNNETRMKNLTINMFIKINHSCL